MALTLRQLTLFCAIAETGSTTAAAAQVALSQSATSAALNELESTLGTRLFDRIGKRLAINEEGRSLLPAARALLQNVKDIESSFAAGTGGTQLELRLAASTTIGNYVLPPMLASFRRAWPAARLNLSIGNTQEVVESVAALDADLGLVEGPCHSSEVTVLPWLEDELVVVAAPAHALARAAAKKPLTHAQLRGAPWLLREAGSGTRETAEQALLPHLHDISVEMMLGSSEAIKNAVAVGLGISCLSRFVVSDLLAARKLVVLASRLPRLSRRLAIIHHRQKRLSPALAAFVETCQHNS
jgi:DNA-binding transcriptional LysR family regulator